MGPMAASHSSGPRDERPCCSPLAAEAPAAVLPPPGRVCSLTRSTGAWGPGAPHLPQKDPQGGMFFSCSGDLKLFYFQNKENKAPLTAVIVR